jgi:hypothetical protein
VKGEEGSGRGRPIPRIYDRNSRIRETSDIARHHDLVVHDRRRRDETVGHAARSLGGEAAPAQRDAIVDQAQGAMRRVGS